MITFPRKDYFKGNHNISILWCMGQKHLCSLGETLIYSILCVWYISQWNYLSEVLLVRHRLCPKYGIWYRKWSHSSSITGTNSPSRRSPVTKKPFCKESTISGSITNRLILVIDPDIVLYAISMVNKIIGASLQL